MSGDDLTTVSSVLNEINKKFKYIIVMRHPLDLVFSYFLSGRTTRLGTDPRYNKINLLLKLKNLKIYLKQCLKCQKNTVQQIL